MRLESSSTENNTHSRRRLFLLYHELRPSQTDYSYVVPVTQFEQHLDLLAATRAAADAPLWPEITFDDGHISNFEYALTILTRRGMRAHFFITVGWTGKKPGYMDWPELRALHSAGQIVGAHGWTHTLLTHCSEQDLQLELNDARQTLEQKLGAPVTTMSLPGGRFNARVLAACRAAGYTEVFTSIPRSEPAQLGPTIGRLNIRGDMPLPWIASLLAPGSDTLAGLERQYRLKDTAKSLLGDRLYARLWGLLNREEPDPADTNLPA